MANQFGGATILWETAAIDFASSLTLTSDESAVTVTGAKLGDPVILGQVTAPASNTMYSAHVSAANTVQVRFNNYSAGTINPGSQVFNVGVISLN